MTTDTTKGTDGLAGIVGVFREILCGLLGIGQARDHERKTLLHYAVIRGCEPLVKALLAAGVDPGPGESPFKGDLHHARQYCQLNSSRLRGMPDRTLHSLAGLSLWMVHSTVETLASLMRWEIVSRVGWTG